MAKSNDIVTPTVSTPVDPDRLGEWLAIPMDQLPLRSPVPLTVVPTRKELFEYIAAEMFDEARSAKERGEPLAVIVPLGPTGHYPVLAERIEREGLELNHVTFFGMDDWLDWEGRPLPLEHPFSLRGRFDREFLNRLPPALRPEPANVIFPDPFDLERPSEEIGKRGGVATTYGGFGFQGHIAFNEPPGSRWSPVSLEQLRGSRTRVVQLAVDTLIAHAQRSLGGNVFGVPPMAVTLGMRDLLSARRVRLYTDGGAWKQTILRILLFADATVDYPVTLVRDHPDLRVVVDAGSAERPPGGMVR